MIICQNGHLLPGLPGHWGGWGPVTICQNGFCACGEMCPCWPFLGQDADKVRRKAVAGEGEAMAAVPATPLNGSGWGFVANSSFPELQDTSRHNSLQKQQGYSLQGHHWQTQRCKLSEDVLHCLDTVAREKSYRVLRSLEWDRRGGGLLLRGWKEGQNSFRVGSQEGTYHGGVAP